jgi:hypothetical protein
LIVVKLHIAFFKYKFALLIKLLWNYIPFVYVSGCYDKCQERLYTFSSVEETDNEDNKRKRRTTVVGGRGKLLRPDSNFTPYLPPCL